MFISFKVICKVELLISPFSYKWSSRNDYAITIRPTCTNIYPTVFYRNTIIYFG